MKASATAIAVSVVALAAASVVHAAEYEIQLKAYATSDATVLDKVGDTVIGTNDAPTSAPVAYEPERSGCPVSSDSPPRRGRRRFG